MSWSTKSHIPPKTFHNNEKWVFTHFGLFSFPPNLGTPGGLTGDIWDSPPCVPVITPWVRLRGRCCFLQDVEMIRAPEGALQDDFRFASAPLSGMHYLASLTGLPAPHGKSTFGLCAHAWQNPGLWLLPDNSFSNHNLGEWQLSLGLIPANGQNFCHRFLGAACPSAGSALQVDRVWLLVLACSSWSHPHPAGSWATEDCPVWTLPGFHLL